MSSSIKTLLALSLVAFVAACASQQEEEVVIVDPVVEEAPLTKY